MGGAAAVKLSCTGCGVTVDFSSSAMCSGASHNAVISVALRLATFISGIGFAGYHTLLKRYLGMNAVCDKQFIAVIHLAYPHIKDILDEVCEEAKVEMKSLPSSQLGSWSRAVTTSDGCWHIRVFFVKTAHLSSETT